MKKIATLMNNYFINVTTKSDKQLQKRDLLQKENYRPVSLLPHISRVFEKFTSKLIALWKTKSQNKARVSASHTAHIIL